jgi:hypothetical protein
MKNPTDPIGNQTRGLPACNAVPQPTAPLRDAAAVHKGTIKGTPVKYFCQSDFWYMHTILPVPFYLLCNFYGMKNSRYFSNLNIAMCG